MPLSTPLRVNNGVTRIDRIYTKCYVLHGCARWNAPRAWLMLWRQPGHRWNCRGVAIPMFSGTAASQYWRQRPSAAAPLDGVTNGVFGSEGDVARSCATHPRNRLGELQGTSGLRFG